MLYAATLAQITVNAPTTLTANVASANVDAPVTLTWSSAGDSICYATGGTAEAPWAGTLPGSGSGSLVVTSRYAGTITYGIYCDNEAQAVVTYTSVPSTSPAVARPAVTLSSSVSTQSEGQSVSLIWNSKNADACSASGGQQGDGWSGNLALSGSMSVTETSAGTISYSITCTGAPPAATAVTTVVVVKSVSTCSSHGGGGALDLLFLLSLVLPVGVRVKGSLPPRAKLGEPRDRLLRPERNLLGLEVLASGIRTTSASVRKTRVHGQSMLGSEAVAARGVDLGVLAGGKMEMIK
jgi:hypothetical protein